MGMGVEVGNGMRGKAGRLAGNKGVKLSVKILIWAKKQIISKVLYFIIFLEFERDLGEDRNKNLQRGN